MSLFGSKRFCWLQYIAITVNWTFFLLPMFICVYVNCITSVYGTKTCSTWVRYDISAFPAERHTPPYQCRKLRLCRIKSGTVHQHCSASQEVWLEDGRCSGYVGQYAANRHLLLIWKTVRVRQKSTGCTKHVHTQVEELQAFLLKKLGVAVLLKRVFHYQFISAVTRQMSVKPKEVSKLFFKEGKGEIFWKGWRWCLKQ